MPNPRQALHIHPKDNVAVVTCEQLRAGETLDVDGFGRLAVLDTVRFGHKIALENIAEGQPVYKYGFPIGVASAAIGKGRWVHSHNLRTGLSGEQAYTYRPAGHLVSAQAEGWFQGFERKDGTVGIRNEIWILPMVSCVNHTGRMILDAYREKHGGAENIFALEQPYGCSQLGDDHATTVRILQNIAAHPNAGGVILLSLGCENNVMSAFLEGVHARDPERVRPLVVQECSDEIAAGVALLEELSGLASRDERTRQPLGKLRIGFKCGASDGLSGVTANPLAGRVCEELVRRGASAVLTEVPEMFGAETILMNRARDEAVFGRIAGLIHDFKEYYLSYGQPIYENPSPGNKEGGITTLEEKSLGCIQKGGNCRVEDVVPYGGQVKRPGLSLLSSPGNDPVSITALASAGCQLLVFTTGRGNPLGSLVPTVKVSSNSMLAARKGNWIDFDAGGMLDGAPPAQTADELLRLVLDAADGGYRTKSERAGYKEIGIFKNGVIL